MSRSGAGGAGAGARARGGARPAAGARPLSATEAMVLEHASSFGSEIFTLAELQAKAVDCTVDDIVAAINVLVLEFRLEILQDARGVVMYRHISAAQAEILRSLSVRDRQVLQEIEKSGDMGMWVKHIKRQTRLSTQAMNKSLKHLMNKKLIKRVHSKAHKSRRLYMLFNIVPSRELTGGAFYTNDTMELDREFINATRAFVKKALKKKGSCTRSWLHHKLNSSPVTTVNLEPEEMQQILDGLEFDGVIRRSRADTIGVVRYDPGAIVDPDPLYELLGTITVPDTLTETPCGTCPVFEDCTPGGVVNPVDCCYLKAWLKD